MEILAKSADRNLLLELSGELDHHGARTALREMEEALDAALPRKLVLDLSGVTFMDSSGIAVILRARQKMQLLDGGLLVRGVPPQARRVLEAAGVNRLVRTKAVNEVTMDFPSQSRNESFARSAAACFAAQMDPTLNELEDIKTAVSEAVTNAIVHGYPDAIGGVTLKLRVLAGNVLELTVKDHGRGIPDVDKARQPMFTTGGEERSGMGFTIMESFMDKVTVRSAVNKGTTVVMRKKLVPRVKK